MNVQFFSRKPNIRYPLFLFLSMIFICNAGLSYADDLYRIGIFSSEKIDKIRIHYNDSNTALIKIDGKPLYEWLLTYNSILEVEYMPVGFHLRLISIDSS